MLNLRRVLKTSIHNGSQQFRLEQEILKSRSVNTDIMSLLAITSGFGIASLAASGNVRYDLDLHKQL